MACCRQILAHVFVNVAFVMTRVHVDVLQTYICETVCIKEICDMPCIHVGVLMAYRCACVYSYSFYRGLACTWRVAAYINEYICANDIYIYIYIYICIYDIALRARWCVAAISLRMLLLI